MPSLTVGAIKRQSGSNKNCIGCSLSGMQLGCIAEKKRSGFFRNLRMFFPRLLFPEIRHDQWNYSQELFDNGQIWFESMMALRQGEYFLVRGQLGMSYEWFTTRCNAVVAFSWELRKGMQNFELPNWMKEMETRITEKGRDDICIWLKLTSVYNRPKPFLEDSGKYPEWSTTGHTLTLS